MKIHSRSHIKGKIDYPEDGVGDIYDGCRIFTDLKLGNKVHISTGVKMVGKESVRIKSRSTVAPGVVIYTSSPAMAGGKNSYCEDHVSEKGKVVIGEDVFIGANSVISKGVEIADGVVIGANSFVENSIEDPNTLWAGNPAEKVKEIDRDG